MTFILGMVGGVLGWALVQVVRALLSRWSRTEHELTTAPGVVPLGQWISRDVRDRDGSVIGTVRVRQIK